MGSFYVLTFSSKEKLEDGHKKGKCRFFFSFWGAEAKLAFGEWQQSIKFTTGLVKFQAGRRQLWERQCFIRALLQLM